MIPPGRDLAQVSAGKNATVFLEPPGCIGYYSGLAMRDFRLSDAHLFFWSHKPAEGRLP